LCCLDFATLRRSKAETDMHKETSTEGRTMLLENVYTDLTAKF